MANNKTRHRIIWKKNWKSTLTLMGSHLLVDDLETWIQFGIHAFGPFIEVKNENSRKN